MSDIELDNNGVIVNGHHRAAALGLIGERIATCSCGKTAPSATCVKANFVEGVECCATCGFNLEAHEVHRHAMPLEGFSKVTDRMLVLYDGHPYLPGGNTGDRYYCGHDGWD